MRALFILVAAVALALPASSGAAQWSAPVNVGSAATFIDTPFIGFGTTGRGLVAWRWQNGVGSTAQRGTRVATRAPNAIFGPEHVAPEMRVPPVVFSTGRAAILTRCPASRTAASGRSSGSRSAR